MDKLEYELVTLNNGKQYFVLESVMYEYDIYDLILNIEDESDTKIVIQEFKNGKTILNDVKDEYILNLIEYECYNNDKGNNVIVSCGHNAVSETPKEIPLINNKMIITYQNKIIYQGEYKKDITKYIKEPGKYIFQITNKRDKISTTINFEINIKEKIVDE